MIQITDIKVRLNKDKDAVITKTVRKLFNKNYNYKIIRESIDARKNIVFVYAILVDAPKEAIRKNTKINYKVLENKKSTDILIGATKLENRPVIIGFGPAGMFAALQLAQKGYCPIVYEQGDSVDKRTNKVQKFWNSGILDPLSNVQFGEGGAGAFSDGKLTTRIKDPIAKEVLHSLVSFGAPAEIEYSYKPHVGTDVLVEVIKNIRKEIIRLGGEINFGAKLEDIEICNKKLTRIKINGVWTNTSTVILGIGHSARDTFRLLSNKKVQMTKKPFAVGFRIEHPQVIIDKAQYKEYHNHPKLKGAEYHLTHKATNGRGCYTFCMCPGGMVIASTSNYNQVVVNGMSYHARDLNNANSAVLCTVTPDDFDEHVLSGMEWQQKIEEKAFVLGGSNYFAPIQLVGDFLKKSDSKNLGSVSPTYLPGVKFARLDQLYPPFVYDAIAEAIQKMGEKLIGFSMEDSILTGVETRSSSPVRITRNIDYEAVETKGLFPCGEGAGYAGGIVSAAVDGVNVANSIIKKYYWENVSYDDENQH